ncbi:transposase, IS116/IS110/IS902 family [Collinsella aerofaciens ATCC 25986]|uniref:Transposase, IS116/IS110/IS902 family n=1 Tax=Collinsella aerofaciens (strain ATCC 25986 / DSM 3979 / JCM 10188 / KCTC 3647 / NCTC 11838 / VPI 1003) TaxID=411903 RepID=A4ECM2_COLAA|nr:transposase, IS116/IS110/IS902 family [Collinsella aerofaciens ATCC 25986]
MTVTGTPKSQDGWVDGVRCMLAARSGAVKARTSAINTARSLLTTAPEGLRSRFRGMGGPRLMEELPSVRAEGALGAALGALADLWAAARDAALDMERAIEASLEENCPALLAMYGCGPVSAAKLAVAAGDNPGRLRSEASFAAICGACPIPASSGKTVRHRLNRGGDRQANSALHEIARQRVMRDPETAEYAERARGRGKSDREVMRCLKRYVDWQHLFGRFREGQPRLPELDRRHVAQRRVDPEVVVPVHVVRELGPELARRAERLAVDELGLQYPVGRLVDGVVVGAALGRQRPLNAEGLEHQVDLGVVELAAAVRVEDLDVRDGEGERRERRLDQPGVLPGPGGVADDLPVVEVDEQADVVPRGPDAHVGQVAAYMGARRPAAEAARDDVGHVGLVDRPGVHLEPLPAVCADQAVLPHDAADPAPADGDARPLERRLYLARAVPALAGGVGRDHGRRGGVRRGGPVGPRAHGVVRRPRDAEEPALR